MGLLCQECKRCFRQQGGDATGSQCGVETRSRSCCLPRLCGTSSDWQSAGLLWLTADSLLPLVVLRKREVGGIAVQQVDMWHCMGSHVQLCVQYGVFILYKKAHHWDSGCCPLTVTPHRSHDKGGSRASIGANSGISNLSDPPSWTVGQTRNNRITPGRKHLHNRRENPLQSWCFCNTRHKPFFFW